MVRSMYSGVSGLSTHQTRMDTIGNNIANVNTYGFKSSRTTFSDIYYQNISSSSAPTGGQGGTNPSQVGYGSQVGSVDLLMTRSTFSMSGQTMDVAIDGDGFLQVMDAAGNIYYTRAGMLNFDSAGNLVDTQGNYVLGVNGDPTGKAAGSERITVALANVAPTPASVEETINGVPFTLTASNNTKDGNINFNFSSDSTLTDGVRATATISSTGIVVTFNANENFSNMAQVNQAINDAIVAANGGQPHAAGTFTLATSDPTNDPFSAANLPPSGYLTGADLASTDYNIQYGNVKFETPTAYFGGITPSGTVGSEFSGTGAVGTGAADGFSATYSAGPPEAWNISMMVNGTSYVGTIDSTRTTSGKFNLVNPANQNDYIEMNRPSFESVTNAWKSDAMVAGSPSAYTLAIADTMDTAVPFVIGGKSITLAGGDLTSQLNEIVAPINADSSFAYTASLNAGSLVLTSKENSAPVAVAYSYTDAATGTAEAGDVPTTTTGTNDEALITGSTFNNAYPPPTGTGSYQFLSGTADPSGESYALGLSSKALTLRNGTEGGPQGLADMTGIAIAGNGIIVGLDSQGTEVYIGRIDLATFANQSGLTQSGSTSYIVSQNSGAPVLSQPGEGSAGQLVSGTLELSNVDLSREFSDMITTQRGYQANSRIITVSDTMLEELINLKR